MDEFAHARVLELIYRSDRYGPSQKWRGPRPVESMGGDHSNKLPGPESLLVRGIFAEARWHDASNTSHSFEEVRGRLAQLFRAVTQIFRERTWQKSSDLECPRSTGGATLGRRDRSLEPPPRHSCGFRHRRADRGRPRPGNGPPRIVPAHWCDPVIRPAQ